MTRPNWTASRVLRENELVDRVRYLRGGSFSAGFMDWLERQRVLAPVARLSIPAPVVRSLAYEVCGIPAGHRTLPAENDPQVVSAARKFLGYLSNWPDGLTHPQWGHPLDQVPLDCGQFVELGVSNVPFKSRLDRRVQLTESDEVTRFRSSVLRSRCALTIVLAPQTEASSRVTSAVSRSLTLCCPGMRTS